MHTPVKTQDNTFGVTDRQFQGFESSQKFVWSNVTFEKISGRIKGRQDGIRMTYTFPSCELEVRWVNRPLKNILPSRISGITRNSQMKLLSDFSETTKVYDQHASVSVSSVFFGSVSLARGSQKCPNIWAILNNVQLRNLMLYDDGMVLQNLSSSPMITHEPLQNHFCLNTPLTWTIQLRSYRNYSQSPEVVLTQS